MNNIIVIVLVTILLAGIAQAFLGSGVKGVAARPLMTGNEIRFWKLLRLATSLNIAPQVAMSALVTHSSGLDSRARRSVRNRFDRKCVDFVLFDDDGQVHLIVELDDRTHRQEREAARDRMTSEAGYRTVRVQGANARDLALLKAAIADALGIEHEWSPVFNPTGAPRGPRGRSARPSSPPA